MMFFDTTRDVKEKNGNPTLVYVLSVAVAILVVVIFATPMITKADALYPMIARVGNTQEVGMILFSKYLVPFELAAIMLLVAMVAGIVLAGKKMDLSLTMMSDAEIKDLKEDTNRKVLS
jgi:NADH-quinone oxidoreductase subunit J